MIFSGRVIQAPDETDLSASRVVISHEVWQQVANWRAENKGWEGRVIENAVRGAAICAAFSGRTALHAEDLGPAYEMIKYQMLLRNTLRPNPGETYEGEITHKFLNYLKQKGNRGCPAFS